VPQSAAGFDEKMKFSDDQSMDHLKFGVQVPNWIVAIVLVDVSRHRRMSRIVFSALSFFVIIVPLAGNDESNVSLIQTACLVRLALTGHT
jgi:hypothetical protein